MGDAIAANSRYTRVQRKLKNVNFERKICMTHCRSRQSSKSLLICPVVSEFFLCVFICTSDVRNIERGNANIRFAFSVHTPLQYLTDDFINFIHIHISIKAYNLSVNLFSSN